tara:strand:+ start:58 stop:216 length:159 start_codon:yes stop_codon:yes gene_type:complete
MAKANNTLAANNEPQTAKNIGYFIGNMYPSLLRECRYRNLFSFNRDNYENGS